MVQQKRVNPVVGRSHARILMMPQLAKASSIDGKMHHAAWVGGIGLFPLSIKVTLTNRGPLPIYELLYVEEGRQRFSLCFTLACNETNSSSKS